ncbi:MAG: neuromedin U [Bacteroidota bacterium]
MNTRKRTLAMLLGVLLLIPAAIMQAQEPSAAELAKKAQNPIANMISVPLQNNTNFGIGPYDRTQNVLNIQPVLPTGLGGWNLINRVIAPVISQPDVTQPTGSEFGLGDIIYEGFFTPAGGGSVTWGVGPVVIFPTATNNVLGSGKWSAGPAAIVVAFLGKFVLGGVAYNAWSFAGNSGRADVNQGLVQYFVNYNLPKAWYLTSSPTITVNWNAPEGNRWIVPFGGGVGKIFGIGSQKLNGQVSAYWNAVKPDAVDGPDWTLRLQLVFLFPT